MARSNRYASDEGKSVWKELEKIHSWGYGYSTIFADFIDLALNSLLSLTANIGKPDFIERVKANTFDDEYNARYLNIVGKYKENADRQKGQRPIDYFTNAWGMVQLETREKQQDILGQIFTERVTHGEAGQFFTPSHMTDMMAKMSVEGATDGQSVFDPCCGSGRFLISASKINPNLIFYGQDIDLRCAKMAALNCWLFDLNAFIKCGDSLLDSWHVAYEVRRGGFMREVYPTPKPERKEPMPSEIEKKAESGKAEGLERQMRLPI